MGDEGQPKPQSFQWPPNRLPPTELNAPAKPMQAGGRHRLASRTVSIDDDAADLSDLVEWGEPEHAEDDHGLFDAEQDGGASRSRGGTDAAAGIPRSPVRGWRRWFEAFEIAYLGRVSASWDVRARDAGWASDEPGTYCPRCGVTVGEFELDTLSDPPTCTRCRERRLAWDGFVRLGAYEGVLASAIRELKFLAMRAHGERLGALLGERACGLMERLEVAGEDVAVVPIPTTPWRRIARGVDHAAILARGVARETGAELIAALGRRHRPTQWSVAPSQRRRNVAGSFRWRGVGQRLIGKRLVLVVDDVRTTGATLTEACKTIRRGLGEIAARTSGNAGREAMPDAAHSPIIVACTLAVARTKAMAVSGPNLC